MANEDDDAVRWPGNKIAGGKGQEQREPAKVKGAVGVMQMGKDMLP